VKSGVLLDWALALLLALLLAWCPDSRALTPVQTLMQTPGLPVTVPPGLQPRRTLDLQGYADAQGAISVLHQGPRVDPYFALQALLLARDHGVDVLDLQARFIDWLAQAQPATGVLARYCRAAQGWRACARADADDAALALWLRLLRGVPAAQRPGLRADLLQARAEQQLRALYNPRTGLYIVSPELPYSLWMDNLEVWTAWPQRALSEALMAHFWQPQQQRFRTSTQPGHRERPERFYPEQAAQIYPLLTGWLPPGQDAAALYARWMQAHRGDWLAHMAHDYPWAPIALLAWQHGDTSSVRCWQQRAAPMRHGDRWTVTDEVVAQLLPPLQDPPPTKEDCQ
jgi:hypothetical protein